MAPAHNDAFNFFMAETTCSEAPSDRDTEDSNLDSLLQQLKSPSYQEPQQCMSDVCCVSDTAEGGFDLLCDQSSAHLTIEDNVNQGMAMSSGVCEMSPGQASVFINQPSPLSVSNSSSVAATAGTHCDLNWPCNTDDESVTDGYSPPAPKTERIKAQAKRRAPITNYQAMTPWTNENLNAQEVVRSPRTEFPCFQLQALKEQNGNCKSPVPDASYPPASRLGTAVTETVYTLTSSPPSRVQSPLKRPNASGVPQISREKRFKKTAEALQKCGLWDIAMKTGDLIRRNSELQREIDSFRAEAEVFLKAVVANPENKELMESLTNGAPITLGRRVRISDGCDSDSTTTTTAGNTSCKVSDGNSSSTSGYASYTEGCRKKATTTHKQS